jgi:hypothetical protein
LRRGLFGVVLAALVGPAASSGVAEPQAGSPAARLDREALTRQVDGLLKKHGHGVEAGVWVGGPGGDAWLAIDAAATRPTASAVKTFFLVELFAAHKGALDRPLPGAADVLRDDHPAISHFLPGQRDEIRRELGTASVRRVGEVMMGKVEVPNVVYNAAANLVTAVLGGPDALTERVRRRDPAFATVSVRRYMLRDRKSSGDNEAPPAAFAALYQRLASGKLAGLDDGTLTAVRDVLRRRPAGRSGTDFSKSGALASDPLTQVRAGWWETGRGAVVYVVMLVQPSPGADDRGKASQSLHKTADGLTAMVLDAAGQAVTGR